jgi:hypothetical protein
MLCACTYMAFLGIAPAVLTASHSCSSGGGFAVVEVLDFRSRRYPRRYFRETSSRFCGGAELLVATVIALKLEFAPATFSATAWELN